MAGGFFKSLKNLGDTISNAANGAGDAISKAAGDLGKTFSEKAGQVGEALSKSAGEAGQDLNKKMAELETVFNKTKDSVISTVDQNGNGQIDVEDIVILALKTPGVRIDRNEFLRTQLARNYTAEIIEKAVSGTPVTAGIQLAELDRIAEVCITDEDKENSKISSDRNIPESVAIVSMYGCLLRVVQKLLYLYGFPDLGLTKNEEQIETGVLNILILCLGVIYEIEGSDDAIKAVAKAMGTKVDRQLFRKALTEGTIKPFVINVAKWFGTNLAKQLGGSLLRKVPVAGGLIASVVLGGSGFTKVSFIAMGKRLESTLRDTYFTRGDIPGRQEEDVIVDMIENDKGE